MTLKLSERELEDLLRRPGQKPKPPADLLARLRADLPAELEMAPPVRPKPSPPATNVLRPARWSRPLISLAASLAVLAGGSLIAYRSFRDTAPPAPLSEAAVAASSDLATVPQRTVPQRTVPQQEKPPAELKAKQDEGERAAPAELPPAGVPAAALREDSQGARTFNLQAGGPIQPRAPKKTELLPLPVAEQLRVAPAPAPPPPEAVATGAAGGVLLDAKERDAAVLPDDAADEEKTELRKEVAAAPPAALEVSTLENPGIEANRQQAALEPPSFGESEKRKETRRLESPTTQGDALRPELSRAAAAAAPKQIDSLSAGADLGDAWRRIERDLAGGAWPSKEAIAAARTPKDAVNAAPAARAAPRGAEPTVDPSVQLREDLLDFLARENHGRHVLLDLRRRAIRLAEKRPDDERVSSVLGLINLAIKLSPD